MRPVCYDKTGTNFEQQKQAKNGIPATKHSQVKTNENKLLPVVRSGFNVFRNVNVHFIL